MTKKDYIKLAQAMRMSKPLPFIGDPINEKPAVYAVQEAMEWGRTKQWESDVMFLVGVLKADNPNFHEPLFLTACGYRLRPDGRMYDFNWERGVIVS